MLSARLVISSAERSRAPAGRVALRTPFESVHAARWAGLLRAVRGAAAAARRSVDEESAKRPVSLREDMLVHTFSNDTDRNKIVAFQNGSIHARGCIFDGGDLGPGPICQACARSVPC